MPVPCWVGAGYWCVAYSPAYMRGASIHCDAPSGTNTRRFAVPLHAFYFQVMEGIVTVLAAIYSTIGMSPLACVAYFWFTTPILASFARLVSSPQVNIIALYVWAHEILIPHILTSPSRPELRACVPPYETALTSAYTPMNGISCGTSDGLYSSAYARTDRTSNLTAFRATSSSRVHAT